MSLQNSNELRLIYHGISIGQQLNDGFVQFGCAKAKEVNAQLDGGAEIALINGFKKTKKKFFSDQVVSILRATVGHGRFTHQYLLQLSAAAICPRQH